MAKKSSKSKSKRAAPPPPAPAKKPSVWDFRDARKFVAAFCAWQQDHDADFSFRKLARYAELGAPNYLQAYLSGSRNIKPETAARVGQGLGLGEHESTFLSLLVQLERAKDPDERAGWYREALAFAVRHSGTGVIDAARLAYFSHWYIPLVHAMGSLRGFRPEAHWIAARTVPKIRSYDAKKALDTLRELGIFEFVDGERGVRVREPRLETEAGLRSIWGREYHKAMIRLSEQSLDTWAPEQRLTSALTVTVTTQQIDQVLKRVDGFRKDLFNWLMTEQEQFERVPGQVMQINFQAFLLTDVENHEN